MDSVRLWLAGDIWSSLVLPCISSFARSFCTPIGSSVRCSGYLGTVLPGGCKVVTREVHQLWPHSTDDDCRTVLLSFGRSMVGVLCARVSLSQLISRFGALHWLANIFRPTRFVARSVYALDDTCVYAKRISCGRRSKAEPKGILKIVGVTSRFHSLTSGRGSECKRLISTPTLWSV